MLETVWTIATQVAIENADVIVGTIVGVIGGWLGISKPKDKKRLKTHPEVDRFWAKEDPSDLPPFPKGVDNE